MASPVARITSVSIVVAALSSAVFAQDNLSSLRPFELSSATHLTLNTLDATRLKALQHANVGGPTLFFDDYSTYVKTDYTNAPFSLVPLSGQSNPAGFVWNSADWFGAATLEIMQAAGATHPVGDSPTMGPIACFAAAARKTGLDAPNPNFNLSAGFLVDRLAPQVGSPLDVVQDIYLSSVDNQPRTSVVWSPASTKENQFIDRIYYGGTNFGVFGENSDGILDRFLDTGLEPSTGGGILFVSAQHPNFPPPVNQWFTIMAHMSKDSAGEIGYSVWVKTFDTMASTPPFLDPRMTAGDIPPVDGEPIGWVNIYPGFPDDPATNDVIEGIGYGADLFGDSSPHTAPLNQAPPRAAITFDLVQFFDGLDPSPSVDPTFAPDDYFFANFRAQGNFVPLCSADINGNLVVDGADLANLLIFWGFTGGPADINGDGVVNGADLATLLTNWGACPN